MIPYKQEFCGSVKEELHFQWEEKPTRTRLIEV